MHTENYTEEMKCIEIIESHDSVNRMVRTNILGFKHRHHIDMNLWQINRTKQARAFRMTRSESVEARNRSSATLTSIRTERRSQAERYRVASSELVKLQRAYGGCLGVPSR